MSTTATKTAKQLLAERDQQVKAYETLAQEHQTATTAGDKKAAASATGSMANRSREIRNLEYQLAESGAEFEPWTKPGSSNGSRSSRPAASKEQVEADLEKAYKVFTDNKFPSVKKTAEARIESLLKVSEKQGYGLKDPRSSK